MRPAPRSFPIFFSSVVRAAEPCALRKGSLRSWGLRNMAHSFANETRADPVLPRWLALVTAVRARCDNSRTHSRRGGGCYHLVTGIDSNPTPDLSSATGRANGANVTGLTGCSCTRRREKRGEWRDERRGAQRGWGLRLNLRLNRPRRVSILLFRKNGREFDYPPPSPARSHHSTRFAGMWVTGLSSPAMARPSPLPEAFPTNCSCERTTTKTKEDPEPPESVILLRRA